MELPPLGSLQILETLTRTRRIGAAAQELGISHAAVSQTVSRLERKYDVQLFERTNWGVVATAATETLIHAYRSASSILSNALMEASCENIFTVLIPREMWGRMSFAITPLRRQVSSLRFSAYQDAELADFLSADFAIRPGGDRPPNGFDGSALYNERLLPVCSPHYARSRKIETVASLARAELLVSNAESWRAWFAHAGLISPPPLMSVVVSDEALAMEGAIRGQGVALCCSVVTAPAISRGELVAPVDLSVASSRCWWATWKRSNNLEPAMRLLEWWLAELNSTKAPHVSLVEDGPV